MTGAGSAGDEMRKRMLMSRAFQRLPLLRLPVWNACAAVAALALPWAGPALAQDPAPYEDKVIEGLAPEPVESAVPTDYDRSGLPRFLKLETRLGTQPFDPLRRTRTGFLVEGLLETPNHGTLSVNGAWSPQKNDNGQNTSTLTLRQRGMPLGDGALLNLEAGVGYPFSLALMQQPSRVLLPAPVQRGLQAEWLKEDNGLQFTARVGEPGTLDGSPAYGFSASPGRRTGLGAQWRWDEPAAPTVDQPALPWSRLPGWTAALQVERAAGVEGVNASGQLATLDAQSALLALRREVDNGYLQAKLMSDRVDEGGSSGSGSTTTQNQGAWLDAEWHEGPRTHGVGLYRLDPGLTWAGQSIANDVQGLYYRANWSRRQWSVDGSVDWLRSITGERADGWYASLSGRQRLNTANTVSAGGAARDFGNQAWSAYGDWRFDNRWGNAGLRLEFYGGDEDAEHSTGLLYDQEWTMPIGWRLDTSAGLVSRRATLNAVREMVRTAAISGSGPLGTRGRFSGGFSTEHGSTGRRRHNLNLNAQWQIDQHWALDASYTRALGQSLSASRSIDPLAVPTTETTRTDDASFYVGLSYQFQAGSRLVPIGGPAGSGGGSITGTVFFDANRSGRQEASEQGVANVPVFLDNRYAVNTDAQGRFSFPLVAPGAHTVTIRSDTLPLPWRAPDAGGGQYKVDVRLRDDQQVNIGIVED